MTAPSLPQAAVEAATKAYNAKKMHTNMSGDAQRYDMEAALLAALPILRAQWAEEVAGAIEADCLNRYSITAMGMRNAASIVRNYTGGMQ